MRIEACDDWVVVIPRDVGVTGTIIEDRALGASVVCDVGLGALISRVDGRRTLGELDPSRRYRDAIRQLNRCGLVNLVVPSARRGQLMWRSLVPPDIAGDWSPPARRYAVAGKPLYIIPFSIMSVLIGHWAVPLTACLVVAVSIGIALGSPAPVTFVVVAAASWLAVVAVHEFGHICAIPCETHGRRFFALFEGSRLSMVTVGHGLARDGIIAACGPCACIAVSLCAGVCTLFATAPAWDAFWIFEGALFALGASSLVPWAHDGRRIVVAMLGGGA